MMKPKIFLSHSKKDKQFIEKIAADLRCCGIDVWYDDWEIPVGDSIRKKIFEEGIPNCDAFFVYLTDHSVGSYWVQKELDSAVFKESEEKHSSLIVFVDRDETRTKLSYDLKALSIPAFQDNYVISLAKLISKAWQAFHKKMLKEKLKESEMEKLVVEKEKFELEKRMFSLEKSGNIDLDKITTRLKQRKIKINNFEYKTFFAAFHVVKFVLADGATSQHIRYNLIKRFEEQIPFTIFDNIESNISEFIGELIIQGLARSVAPVGEYGGYVVLTELGISFARAETTLEDLLA